MDIRDNTRNAVGRDHRMDVGDDGRPVPDVRTPAERAAMRQTGPGVAATGERSIGELIKDLRDETTTLMRQEIALARTEISEKASKAGRNAAYTGVGAVMMYLGLLFGLIALSVGLAVLLRNWAGIHAWWLGPLIVGAIVGVIGAVMTSKGVATLKRESLTPEKTVQSLKEDKQWLQEKVTQ